MDETTVVTMRVLKCDSCGSHVHVDDAGNPLSVDVRELDRLEAAREETIDELRTASRNYESLYNRTQMELDHCRARLAEHDV